MPLDGPSASRTATGRHWGVRVIFFFSSSLAVNALWHGPDRYISGEKSDTQHDWPVSKT